ncbi:MAG: hypothetical protein ACYCS1_07480 [Gammaproteobacteria bacterium]
MAMVVAMGETVAVLQVLAVAHSMEAVVVVLPATGILREDLEALGHMVAEVEPGLGVARIVSQTAEQEAICIGSMGLLAERARVAVARAVWDTTNRTRMESMAKCRGKAVLTVALVVMAVMGLSHSSGHEPPDPYKLLIVGPRQSLPDCQSAETMP